MTKTPIQKRPADISVKHLSWLVPARYQNEDSSLRLYSIIESHRVLLSSADSYNLQILANLLAGICFALWRAVFLTDNEEHGEAFVGDISSFLGNLVANNTVGYVQDRNDRNFTFPFYMQTARHRLLNISDQPPFSELVNREKINAASHRSVPPKDSWLAFQEVLTEAVTKFGEMLDRVADKRASSDS